MDSRFLQDICTISRPTLVVRDLQEVQEVNLVYSNVACSIVSQRTKFEKGVSQMDRTDGGISNTQITFLVGTDVIEGDILMVNESRKYKVSDVEPQRLISGYEGSLLATCKLI